MSDTTNTAGTTDADIDDAAAEAQLQAGFEGNEEVPTERPAPIEAQTPPVVVKPESVTLTKAQFDELMALRPSTEKQFGTAFVKIGGIERWKSQIDANVAAANEIREKITDDKVNALRQEFPEFADGLDIVRKLPVIPVATPADPKAVDELVQQRLGTVFEKLPEMIDQQVELKLLTKAHPDWRTVKDEPGFNEYRNKLSDAERAKLAEAWDADYVAGHISAYKKSKAKPVSAQDINQRRASRMAAAATPTGSGQTMVTSDPESELLDGFNTRRVGN